MGDSQLADVFHFWHTIERTVQKQSLKNKEKKKENKICQGIWYQHTF